ncbi:hypothetical protein PSCICN_00970 [Pseudomonas cichorii]|uniref:hypothetical protein n=1 Tax=Pseudomonas cichorii TaxID=36746 RepID=UPI001910CD6B|nr:hypothetical protein [Pseudomonas cichorii]GFM79405.1 hypothetical protein PSCICN_00970 [Pseudomonas cichorii]
MSIAYDSTLSGLNPLIFFLLRHLAVNDALAAKHTHQTHAGTFRRMEHLGSVDFSYGCFGG